MKCSLVAIILLSLLSTVAESVKKDIAIRQQEKNEKKKLLIELNKSLLDAVTISLHSYDMQAFYIAFLEGSRRKNDAYKHVLLLMKLQRKKNKNIKNDNFISTRHLLNPDKKGFQNLFFYYFTEFRPFSQREKILSAVLNFVRDGPILGPQLNASKLFKEIEIYCFKMTFADYINPCDFICPHLSLSLSHSSLLPFHLFYASLFYPFEKKLFLFYNSRSYFLIFLFSYFLFLIFLFSYFQFFSFSKKLNCFMLTYSFSQLQFLTDWVLLILRI